MGLFGKCPFGNQTEVFDAEIHGALRGLRDNWDNPHTQMLAHTITVFFDNEEAVPPVYSEMPATSSYDDVLAFRQLRVD